MPTETVKIVDPDNGPGTHYLSADAWEDNYGGVAGAGDCVGEDTIAVADLRSTSGTDDTAAVDISGWTSHDTTRYLKLWTDPDLSYRHSGKYEAGTATYCLKQTVAGSSIGIYEDNVYVEGLVIAIANSAAQWSHGISLISVTDIHITHNVFVDTVGGNSGVARTGIDASGAGTRYVGNNKFYDFTDGSHYSGTGPMFIDGGTWYVYHNTVVDCDMGIWAYSGTVVLKNNLTFGSTWEDYYGTFDAASTHNGYTTGKAGPTGGSNAIDVGSNGAVIFVDYSNDDFHVQDGSTAVEAGTDLSADANFPITDDIDGDTRPSAGGGFDIGADEVPLAGVAELGSTGSGSRVTGVPRRSFSARRRSDRFGRVSTRPSQSSLTPLRAPTTYTSQAPPLEQVR